MISQAKLLIALTACVMAAALSGCVTAPTPRDYSAFNAESPRSILVVPVLNNTVNVKAPEFFLSTVSRPFAERGYYVFPAHMVNRMLDEEGLSDAGLVHSADARKLGKLFDCDGVLYVTIQRWDSQYAILSTTTTVKFDYALKSCKTGALLWDNTQTMVYSPQSSSGGGSVLGALIAKAIIAAMEKGAPNFMPLTIQANALAAGTPGQGLPDGPYLADKKLQTSKTGG